MRLKGRASSSLAHRQGAGESPPCLQQQPPALPSRLLLFWGNAGSLDNPECNYKNIEVEAAREQLKLALGKRERKWRCDGDVEKSGAFCGSPWRIKNKIKWPKEKR